MAALAGSSQSPVVWLRDEEDADLEAMYYLDASCFEAPFRFSRTAMRHFTRARGAFTILAEDRAGGMVGFVVVQVNRERPSADAYVVTLDVRQDVRRQGIAGRLLRAAEIRAARDGAARMGLHVWTENGGAIRFYEREGYERTLLHPDFYGSGIDALGYAKALAQREAVIQSA